jgi:hypothetical protein
MLWEEQNVAQAGRAMKAATRSRELASRLGQFFNPHKTFKLALIMTSNYSTPFVARYAWVFEMETSHSG